MPRNSNYTFEIVLLHKNELLFTSQDFIYTRRNYCHSARFVPDTISKHLAHTHKCCFQAIAIRLLLNALICKKGLMGSQREINYFWSYNSIDCRLD